MEHEHEHEHKANVAIFHDEEAELIDFKLDTCVAKINSFGYKTVAEVVMNPSSVEFLAARTGGIVRLNEMAITGREISKGATIAQIVSQSTEESLELREAKAAAALEEAETNYKRKESLLADHITTETDVAEAKAKYLSAKAEFENIRAIGTKGIVNVNATKNGTIGQIFVKNGEIVSTGEKIAEIIGNGNMLLNVEAPSRLAQQLRETIDANICIDGKWKKLSDFGGKILGITNGVSTSNPAFTITFDAGNAEGLIAGTFIDICLLSKSEIQSISIPQTAIIEEMGTFYVFVRIDEEEYQKRQVTIGRTDGINCEITSGLNEGDIIVGRGAMIVKLSMQSSQLDAHSGHVH